MAYSSHYNSSLAIISVLNVKRTELPLRRDVEIEVENADVDSALIPCAGDTHAEQGLIHGGGITLVDNNELSRCGSQLDELVTAFVGHHQDGSLFIFEYCKNICKVRFMRFTSDCFY